MAYLYLCKYTLGMRSLLFAILTALCLGEVPELHVVTWVDRPTRTVCASALSAARHDVPYRVIDLPERSGFWPRDKVLAQQLYLRTLPPSNVSLFMFNDAFDVIFVAPLTVSGVTAQMKAIAPHTWDTKPVFSAERNCYPYMDGDQELRPGGRDMCTRLSAGKRTSFRYINSGGWVATVSVAKAFVETWLVELGGGGDDQETAHRLSSGVELDDMCTLFQTGWGTPIEKGRWEDWTLPNCSVHNPETKTVAPIVHLNGDKRHFDALASNCEFVDPHRRLSRARLRALSKYSSLLEACVW